MLNLKTQPGPCRCYDDVEISKLNQGLDVLKLLPCVAKMSTQPSSKQN